MNRIRPFIGSMQHLIEVQMPQGNARIVTTLCSPRSVEELKVSLQKMNEKGAQKKVYSIYRAPITMPNWRCDACTCQA